MKDLGTIDLGPGCPHHFSVFGKDLQPTLARCHKGVHHDVWHETQHPGARGCLVRWCSEDELNIHNAENLLKIWFKQNAPRALQAAEGDPILAALNTLRVVRDGVATAWPIVQALVSQAMTIIEGHGIDLGPRRSKPTDGVDKVAP